MSYPFTTFPLVNRVGVTNPYSNVDGRYGPWNNRNEALTSFNAGLRSQGLTLGIIENGKVVEYWYRDGVLDTDLVLKTPDVSISGYLPLSGGTITGNLSVLGVLSSSYIKNLNEIVLEANKINIKTHYPWSQAILTHKNSSEFLIQSGSENYLSVFSISSLKVNIESPIEIQNTLKIENIFDSEKNEPINTFSFRDDFVEPVNSLELNLHTPNIYIETAPNSPLSIAGNSWTRIFQSNASAKLMVYANSLEAKPETTQAFQGVIYQAETTEVSPNNNYEVKVFLNEISPANVNNFDVFWLLARIVDVNNFYAVRFGIKSGDCVLYRKKNGAFTFLKQLPDLNPNFRNNINFSLRVHDNKISIFYNNGLVYSHIDITASFLPFGKAGIGIGNIGVRGNDSIDIRTRFKRFTITRYSEFEKHSYIFNNNFGIGTKTPNEKLTVSGNISSNNLIYDLGGNSQQWNSNFTTVCTLSSQWSQSTNIIPTVTNYLSTNNVFFSSVSIVSGSNSFKWTEAYTAVAANSATTWNYQGTDVKNLTSKYENLLTFITNTSANWEESAEIIPTVTNHLSTNLIQVSSVISQEGLYDAGYFWKQYQAPNNNNWQSVTYGNGLFVGIANSNVVTPNKIMTSPDGINWTLRQVPVQNNWVSITYGNGLFVAVADDGNDNQRFLTSTDSINWTPINTPTVPWNTITYGNGRFVAVGNPPSLPSNTVAVSLDGINWNFYSVSFSFKHLIYGNNTFVGITNTTILSSSDGTSFNAVYTNNTEQFNGITYGNGLFLVTSNTGSVYSAKADSTNYTRIVNSNPNFTNSKPYYANGLYFIISRDTGVWVSQDTLNWRRPINNLTGSAFRDICYRNGVYVLLANGLANDNNIFVSGKIKNIESNEFNPRYGGLNLYGNLTSNNLVIASSGNSQLWTEVYSRVAANSSTWNAAGSPNVNLSSIFATVCSLSTNWNSVYNTTCALSTNWSSVYAYWNPLTANTSTAVNFVNNNSTNILNVNTKVNNASANWDSTYSQLCALSAKWNTPYDTALNVNSTNAVENSAIAVKIQSLENGLNILVPQPVYSQPVATLTNFDTLIYEVGDTATQTITLGFTQNDAGSPTLYRLERNGFFLGQQTFPFSYNVNEIVVQGTVNFQNTVFYNEGPTKNNLLGLPDTRGKILAGSTSTIKPYIGRYRQFFGSVSSVPTNLRTLTGNIFDNINNFTFYAHQVNNVLAIPATKSLQNAVTQNNETVTGNFVLSGTSVNDANGVPVSYKRYVQTTNVPFNVNITFTLTTP